MTAPELNTTSCNLFYPFWLRHLLNIARADLIIFIHSAPQGLSGIPRPLRRALARRRGKMVFFARNEFKGFQEKYEFVNELGVEYIASQLPLDVAKWVYEPCPKSEILAMPHALNKQTFTSSKLFHERPIDIGVRSVNYPLYLGDRQRVDMLYYIAKRGPELGLTCDISLEDKHRFNRKGWASFLGNCKATASTEAGAAILERDDKTRLAIEEILKKSPTTTYNELYEQFFASPVNGVSGKCISSRHFEAIGTKTCQIMHPGRFNDILISNEHYITLQEDYSNFEDVVRQIRDHHFCRELVERAYAFALSAHTYRHRVCSLLNALGFA